MVLNVLSITPSYYPVCREFEEEEAGGPDALSGCHKMMAYWKDGYYPCWCRVTYQVTGSLNINANNSY